MMKRTILASASVLAMTIGGAYAGPVTDADLLNDAKNPKEVVTNGMGLQAHRFSILDKVNTKNVHNLVPAWSFSFGGEKQRGQEAQALVHDGMVFVTGSYSRLFAMDAKTGEKIWEYDARLPEGIMPCCDVVNRGPAIYGDKVYFSTLDAQIIALDYKTGKVKWQKAIDDFKAGYSNSAAPMIVPTKANGALVITGVSGGEFGVVGRVEARDVNTGEIVWTRPVLEGMTGTYKGKDTTMTGKANETWAGDMYKTGGGAHLARRHLRSRDQAGVLRHRQPGAVELLDCVRATTSGPSSRIAIDPENGEMKWGFQTTPHDGWDFDGVERIHLVRPQARTARSSRPARTADRNGFFYVARPHQRQVPRAPTPFVEQDHLGQGDRQANGRPIYNDDNRPGDPTKSADGKEGQGGVRRAVVPRRQEPDADGLFRPDTGLFYVPSNEWGMDIHNEPVAYKKGAAYLGAGLQHQADFRRPYRLAEGDRSRRPARSCGNTRTRRRCGAAC